MKLKNLDTLLHSCSEKEVDFHMTKFHSEVKQLGFLHMQTILMHNEMLSWHKVSEIMRAHKRPIPKSSAR